MIRRPHKRSQATLLIVSRSLSRSLWCNHRVRLSSLRRLLPLLRRFRLLRLALLTCLQRLKRAILANLQWLTLQVMVMLDLVYRRVRS